MPLTDLTAAEQLKERCQSSCSKEELACAVDDMDTLVNHFDALVVNAEKQRDHWKGVVADRKLEKKKAETLRDSVKRTLQNVKADFYAQRP